MIEMVEMSDWKAISSREGERKSEPLEIGLNGLERWVLLTKLQCCGELRLNSCLERDRNCSDTNLGTLRAERSAKPLKMGTERHDVPTKAFVK